ncbi:DEKNAAC100570 [Brettanomyces naardenensis]|uniref:DEKNAAC100570 n=1 Tax=Brettanomyces naardenensis TaxID=13370 RepID=A0A448YF65_BRENA|nr:DEKNAAC100570 [Brettanomyces naardenensis]
MFTNSLTERDEYRQGPPPCSRVPSEISSHILPSRHSTNYAALSPRSSELPPMFPEMSFGLPPALTTSNQPSFGAHSTTGRLSSGATTDYSHENLIDAMEKEQEGIVLKLMREIQLLKDENRQLKQQISRNAAAAAAAGVGPVCTSPIASPPTINTHSTHSSSSSVSSHSSLNRSASQRKSVSCATLTNAKRLPSLSGTPSGFQSIPQYQHSSDFLSSYEYKQGRRVRNSEGSDRELALLDFSWRPSSSRSTARYDGYNREYRSRDSEVSPLMLQNPDL